MAGVQMIGAVPLGGNVRSTPYPLGALPSRSNSRQCNQRVALHADLDLVQLTRRERRSTALKSTSSAPAAGPDGRLASKDTDPVYGLTVNQMEALGLGRPSGLIMPSGEPDLESLRASSFYCGDEKVMNATRMITRMGGGGSGGGGGPSYAPPDLPSQVLDARILYIGMPLVPAVTELVISELLWLNFHNPEKHIYVYLNSMGSQQPDGQSVGFEAEAYAILDMLAYIKPEAYTLVVGQAFGNAAMIAASGKKGHRFALEHARMMTAPPRMNRTYGSTTNIMIKANELEYNTQQYVQFMSRYTGRPKEDVRVDIGRNRYFTPAQAIEYGLIDKIIRPKDKMQVESRDYEAQLIASNAQRSGRSRGAGQEAAAGSS